MTDTFRALCAELLDWAEHTTSHYYKQPDVIIRARAALAQPEPVAPTDDELDELYFNNDAGRVASWRQFARAVLARWGAPTAQPMPVAVSERLPGAEDCIQRANDHWCWGQERSLLTGQAAARWRLMRVSSLEDEAVAWLPHWALPVPTPANTINQED